VTCIRVVKHSAMPIPQSPATDPHCAYPTEFHYLEIPLRSQMWPVSLCVVQNCEKRRYSITYSMQASNATSTAAQTLNLISNLTAVSRVKRCYPPLNIQVSYRCSAITSVVCRIATSHKTLRKANQNKNPAIETTDK